MVFAQPDAGPFAVFGNENDASGFECALDGGKIGFVDGRDGVIKRFCAADGHKSDLSLLGEFLCGNFDDGASCSYL